MPRTTRFDVLYGCGLLIFCFAGIPLLFFVSLLMRYFGWPTLLDE